MTKPILVFCEQRDGGLKRVGLEVLGEACRLGGTTGREVAAVLIGSAVAPLATTVAGHGADRVLVADDPGLALYSSARYATVLAEVATRLRPAAVLMGATAMGRDLAPKLAARLKTSLAQDCVALEMEPDGAILATRPVYGGKLRAVVKATSPFLQVVTLRPNVFPLLERAPASETPVERVVLDMDAAKPAAVVRAVRETAGGEQDLTEAAVVVSGGRGLKAPEHFTLIEALAAALGGAVGASRAAVDAGWKPHAYQVGLTGKTVSPQLYVACGISGAIQHQAGMSSARTIVAINSNPHAPIFKLASYGIVGDLFELVPLLTEEIKKLKMGG
jgi:electron transfer flavoprotein alpha subunit